MKRNTLIVLAIILGLGMFLYFNVKGTYNNLVNLRENVDGQWAQVENVYQRRADLIPNLVSTVKGYSDFEQSVLTDVADARAQVGQIKVTKEVLEDPKLMERFSEAQNQLGQTLSRLLSVAENYPDLKASQQFADLMRQLEGSENRITNERKKFNDAAKVYNASVKQFPATLYAGSLGFDKVSYFQSTEGSEAVPQVKFD